MVATIRVVNKPAKPAEGFGLAGLSRPLLLAWLGRLGYVFGRPGLEGLGGLGGPGLGSKRKTNRLHLTIVIHLYQSTSLMCESTVNL